MKRLIAAAALCLAPAAALAGGVPFPDGRYVDDASLCDLTMDDVFDRLGGSIGDHLRTLEGTTVGGYYEATCYARGVTERDGKVTLKGECDEEGDTTPFREVWTRKGIDSFGLKGRTFLLCKASTR